MLTTDDPIESRTYHAVCHVDFRRAIYAYIQNFSVQNSYTAAHETAVTVVNWMSML